MELRDLLITPVVITIVYVVAYLIRPRVTDDITRIYFIPALSVKIVGALAVGFIYQFYYDGGDTYNYHTQGSRLVWEAFIESPEKGIKLLFGNGSDEMGIYKYSSRIVFFHDPSSYTVVRIASVLDIITFSTYSATAVLFAVFSFTGMWMFFLTFYKQYPHMHRMLSVAAFFVPSVFFWGSGLLKDTITLGCLGMATYSIYMLFIQRRLLFKLCLLLFFSLWGLYAIKVYILLIFLPASIIWLFITHLQAIRSPVLKIMLFPFVISIALALGYYAMIKAGEDSAKYSLNNLAQTAQITAYDIRYYTGRDAGSGYSLGKLDGTFSSMLSLAPQAINVSLFRPYLWEANNAFMFLSALENLLLLLFCLYILFRQNLAIPAAVVSPNIFFAMIFSISFAFAVGVSTFNFGTLVRYKIPMLPFFMVALVLMLDPSNKDKKLEVLEITE